MLKAFLISILSFVMVFVCQTNSWAEIENSTKFIDVIALENSNNIQKDKEDLIFERSNLNALSNFSIFGLWAPNLLLPGLAQIMMGEINTGIFCMLFSPHMFFLLCFIVAKVTSIEGISFSENSSNGIIMGVTLTPVFWLTVFISIRSLANAIDLAIIKISEEEKAKELSFIRNNIRISNNGLEVKVFSF